MKERQRHSLPNPVFLLPGDTFKCRVPDRQTKQDYIFEEKIGRTQKVDTVVTFDVDEPVLGLSSGIGAIFGEAT